MEVFVLTALSELRKKSTSWLGGGDKDFHLECDKTIGEVVYLSKIHMRNWLALCSSQNSSFPPIATNRYYPKPRSEARAAH